MAVPAGLTVGLVASSIFRADLRRAAVGAVATAVAMAALVQAAGRLGYVGGVAVGLVVAVLTGAGIDAVVVRRFRLSARLVLTVATIGLAQFFAVGALLVPRVWGRLQLTNGSRTSFGVPGVGW